jgi:hypothetical protein
MMVVVITLTFIVIAFFKSLLLRNQPLITRSELIHDAQPYCDVTMEGGWGAANGWTSIRSLCPGVVVDVGDAHRIPNQWSDMRVVNHQQPILYI